jgi:RNA polymerase sigma factor (sigma-70 family)
MDRNLPSVSSRFFQNFGTLRACGYIIHIVAKCRPGRWRMTTVSIKQDGAVLRQLRMLFNVGSTRELTDGQLLERFATERGEAAELAFSAFVERHGPMVLRVCRGILADPNDAQDAFQTTFLVLVQKAQSLWVRHSLGPWLYRVAYKSASCYRSAAARRRWHERHAPRPVNGNRDAIDDELGRVLYEEIDRLPERQRAPVVLCDLEGRTYEQAARQLGWPIGTVKSRLSRGRNQLRDRLVRRGFGFDKELHATALGIAGLHASIPPSLVDCATRAAIQFAAARTIGRGPVASLTQEVIRSMLMTRLVKIGSVLIMVAATTSSIGLLAQKGTSGAGPRPGENIKAERDDDKALFVVKPGKLKIIVVASGTVEPARSENAWCKVEGSRTILSILPEGTQVKKGQLVCELDASTAKDRLAKLADTGNEQSEAAKLRMEIERCKLHAPVDGTIVYFNDPASFGGRPQIEAGATVRERQIIFRLLDFDGPMRVKTKVHESEVDRVTPGLPARMRLESFPGEILTGTVKSIAPLPDAQGFFSGEINVYTTWVSIDKRLPGLRPGMSAQVQFLVNELENVLSVPLRALLWIDGTYQAVVKRPDGGFDRRKVTLGGRSTDYFVEIKKGIQSGESVILNPRAWKRSNETPEKPGSPAKPVSKK